ncbi:aldo/keto reductase [Halomicrobium sp. HM KBTZ05]|uniref:aldo/keto reductase n=1 Tax=Halomicrobium sp. HM KBTZ05 TaxID=3242663 RepID=UPI0035582339
MTELPPVGIGTWENTDPEACANAVQTALEMGYRHVDTADIYGNEEHVGAGIARADVDREAFVLASKAHTQATGLTYDAVIETAEQSLDRLGVDALDLFYVHWPTGEYDAEETLPAFDELVADGLIREVGVSNFTPELVEEAMDVLDAPVFANQVEMHPLLQQAELVAHAQAHDYYLVAYSPLARGDVFEVPKLNEIADKHGVSEAQVSLAWLRSKDNVVAIPKATSRAHIEDNYASLDLALDEEDIATIDGIEREDRHLDFEAAPWN